MATEHNTTKSLFEETNLIDDASMKLSIASAILNALHEQHNDLRNTPSISQKEISVLIFAALRLVESADASVQSMPFKAGERHEAEDAEDRKLAA